MLSLVRETNNLTPNGPAVLAAAKSIAALRAHSLNELANALTINGVPYIIAIMKNIRKHVDIIDLDDDAKRQYVDAKTVFEAWETAHKAASTVRGGMYWRRTGQTEYLIRTSRSNTQKSLGPRTAETEAVYNKFFEMKNSAEARQSSLRQTLNRHQKLNRVLHVGRAPVIVVGILNVLATAGLSEHFTVVGTHALYAFETAAGVRIRLEWAVRAAQCRQGFSPKNLQQFGHCRRRPSGRN